MSDYPWGGSEELWSQAALRLHGQGHDVAASVPWWPEERLSRKLDLLKGQDNPVVFSGTPASLSHRLKSPAWRFVRKVCWACQVCG
jgi:hypothetical protein